MRSQPWIEKRLLHLIIYMKLIGCKYICNILVSQIFLGLFLDCWKDGGSGSTYEEMGNLFKHFAELQ